MNDARDSRFRLFLVCLLLGTYLLVYTAQDQSVDGQAILAVASNLVLHGSPDIAAIGASEDLLPLPARMGRFGADGLLYAKKGPTPSLALLPLVAWAHLVPWLPIQATAMLFNPLVTTALAVTLYTLTRRIGYRPLTALIAALILGLATFTISYVKTLFGEPLAALLLTQSLLSAITFRQQARSRDLLVSGVMLGLAAGINLTYVVLVPVIGLYALGGNARRWKPGHLAAIAAPVLAALVLLGLYNLLRFGSALDSGYHFDQGEDFSRPVLIGLFGLFASPYRGLFWYNPVLLLAIPGWALLRRRDRPLANTVLLLMGAQALSYAAWWSWHGGIVWGPRFLLPVTPLAVLCLAPLIERALTQRTPALHVALVGLTALSVGIAALGALYSYIPYSGYLIRQHGTGDLRDLIGGLEDEVLVNPSLSPIIGHLALVKARWPLEAAAFQPDPDPLHLLAALALIGMAGLALAGRFREGAVRWAAIVIAVLSLNLVAARQQAKPGYEPLRALHDALQPPGTVVAATTLFGSSLVDLDNGSRAMTTNAPTQPDDPLAAGIWRAALERSKRLWLITWFPPASAENWQERDLWSRAAFITERPLAEHRALLFDVSPTVAPGLPGGWRFGPLTLDSYGVQRTADGIQVTLQWSAQGTPEHDYTWFVHLLDASQTIVAQQDRAPQGGYAPTSTWEPGTSLTDYLFFPLPDETSTDGWALRIGFVNPATGARLPAQDQHGAPLPDGFIIIALAADSGPQTPR